MWLFDPMPRTHAEEELRILGVALLPRAALVLRIEKDDIDTHIRLLLTQ